MMWLVQILIEWVSAMLAQDEGLNAAFAVLVLWNAFGRSPRVCAVLIALVHLVLVMS